MKIQLMIEIDEEDYKIMKHNVEVDNPLCPLSQKEIVTKIANGTPLPEGHGRLGDLDDIRAKIFNASMDNYFMPIKPLSCDDVTDIIDKADTIIEADKGNGEQNRCGNCKEFGTVSCAETYREPIENDKACECYKGE